MSNSNNTDNKHNHDSSEFTQTLLAMVGALLLFFFLSRPNIIPSIEDTPTTTIAIPSQIVSATKSAPENSSSEPLATKLYQKNEATIIAEYVIHKTSEARIMEEYREKNPNTVWVIDSTPSYDPSRPSTFDNPRPIYPSCPTGCKTYELGCNIKGNISFDAKEKIYHLPGQTLYSETVINSEFGELWFCTEEEAINNGWRKSSN